ncbi:MAG: NADH-quinone oxidoreductase subunit NuoF [Lentisphaeria bacterium]|nr:NADH-quinone oxidoreductase subunit NuoF [Lentisphaeria bacterium]
MRIETAETLKEYAASLRDGRPGGLRFRVLVSMGTCGIAAGTTPVLEALREEISARGLGESVEVVETGCMGLCHSEPTVEVEDLGSGTSRLFGNLDVSQAASLADMVSGSPGALVPMVRDWYYPEFESNERGCSQARIVLRNSGRIQPERIDEYILVDGYQALARAITSMTPAEVIGVIRASGLRGRGGGGFPTGTKWQFAAERTSDEKYVICNADEGDPGAFMDRAVLEGDPHSVLEAMAIAGYAIGSRNGIIYIRAEYPLAIHRLEVAIAQAREKGLLGDRLLGTDFGFDIELKYGAGAFVCGEETALIHSIEGKRGEPTFKPPFPAIAGLWGKPTIVNNVETFANVCAILRRGAEWFRGIGTEKSPGTKVFALAGKISRVGLIEVPMGMPLRQIIFGVGGGIRDGKEFKAVQTGGPSGGCIRPDYLDTPIDYETLRALGSMMGSGGMIVMDEDDCMVNVAKFFLEFTLDESCGKCTPCRVGNKRLHEMLEAICNGKATAETLSKLRTLALIVKDTSLCGLGQTSPNPVLSTLQYFAEEYRAHVEEKRCPAGVCARLITYVITDKCVGCTLCARNCPVGCISGERREQHSIDQDACIKCGVCYETCKFHAIEKR